MSGCPAANTCYDLGSECQVRYALQLESFMLASLQLSFFGVSSCVVWTTEAPAAGPVSNSSGHARNYVWPQKDYIKHMLEPCSIQQQPDYWQEPHTSGRF